MMGRREDRQGQFFYEFNLDDVVPPDHLVRKIDAVLDLGWVHKALAPYYSHTDRPSIDPVLMIRMLIVGYVFAIRSERRICAEVQVNLAYRWYCRLGIEDKIPDHSVFSRARHERFRESDALRRVFERVVGLCIAAGLVGGEAFSIDASLIKADVDKKKRSGSDQPIDWPTPEEASHAVREYLAALDAARRDEESGGGGDGSGSSNSGGGKPPKQISLTDPQAAWVARKGVDPAHPQTRSASPARLERRAGRGAANRHGAEPEAARQAHVSKSTASRRVPGVSVQVASGVGAKALMLSPRRPQRAAYSQSQPAGGRSPPSSATHSGIKQTFQR